ncbi:MAG: protein of unknown function DUF86 [uncultured bacterium]|nr:MAG: protein of unknown function DUF86 [uncultured bacterium]
MKKDNLVYIEDILDSCDKILSYIGDAGIEQLEDDRMLVDAIVRNIEVIGEASKRLDDDFRKTYPDFPVRGAITMRNKLIHEYNMVDYEVVLDTVKQDIPELRKLCMQILK